MPFNNLSVEEMQVLRKLMLDEHFQDIIGIEQWSLTEAEEEILWGIIKAVEIDSV